MEQNLKELLLRDLCTRLPYHPVLHFEDRVQQEDECLYGFRENSDKFLINDAYYVEEVRPYLRPMSSMTKEEREEYLHISLCDVVDCEAWNEVDWLNSHHFDYRGLIEKGLALEAPKGMYNVEK